MVQFIWLWINTYRYIFRMNIHKFQLFWGSLGTRVLTHPHIICSKLGDWLRLQKAIEALQREQEKSEEKQKASHGKTGKTLGQAPKWWFFMANMMENGHLWTRWTWGGTGVAFAPEPCWVAFAPEWSGFRGECDPRSGASVTRAFAWQVQ